MTVVVTGSTGFVGNNLVRALLAAGQPVRALVYLDAERERLAGLDVEIMHADVTDVASLECAFAGAALVYHLAGRIELSSQGAARMQAINVRGVQNVVAACQAQSVQRLVHISSFHAMQQTPFDVPVTEDSPLVSPDFRFSYNRTKAAGERVVRAAMRDAGLDTVILRPTGIIGPHDYEPSLFGSILQQLARGSLPGLVDGYCDWVDVRDVTAGIIAAATKAPTGATYILSGHNAHLREIAEVVAAHTGVPAPRFVAPRWLAMCSIPASVAWARVTGKPLRLTLDSMDAMRPNPHISHKRAARELGYQPRPLAETIVDTLDWFFDR